MGLHVSASLPSSMSRSVRLLLLTVAALATMAGCSGEAGSPDDEVVATVGDGAITAGEFADAYARTVLQAGGTGPGAAEAVLESLIARELLIQGALADGIAESPAFRQARALAETKALVDRYAAAEMSEALAVTEADLREQFVQAHTTYDARHLYARDRATAERLRQRVLAGEPFEAVAREVFADSTLAASGGSVGPFGHDEMDPAFEAAAFRLPIGEVSEPVRTATGYSIVRVDARATSPLLTEAEFDRRRHRLTRYVRQRKRTEARFALTRQVRDDLGARFDDAAFGRLVAFATGAEPGLDAEALADWRRTPLVRFDSDVLGGVWTVADVEDRAASMTERQRAAVQDAASLREFIDGLLVREELAARARAAGLSDDDGLARAVAAQTEAWVFEHAKRRLRLDVEVPEAELRAHYDAHAARYLVPERVRASEILVASRAEADALRQRLVAGADFAALARAHSLRLGAATSAGDLGLVSRAQLGRLADLVFDAAPGALVGPVEVEGRYALLQRGEREPARPMTFAEARPAIRDALDVPLAQRRLADAVAALRQRFPVTIDREALARLAGAVPDVAQARPRPDPS